jgi:hypothetical protein
MLPLYATRIEDLGPGDFVKVDRAACHHVALLTPEAPIEGRPEPRGQGSRPQRAAPVSRVREEGGEQSFRSGGGSRAREWLLSHVTAALRAVG